MINKGDIVLCTKPWEGNSLIKGKYGIVKRKITKNFNEKYYWIEFFQYVRGHNRCGKYGHCWIVGEEAVVEVKKGEGLEGAVRNLVFGKEYKL